MRLRDFDGRVVVLVVLSVTGYSAFLMWTSFRSENDLSSQVLTPTRGDELDTTVRTKIWQFCPQTVTEQNKNITTLYMC